MPSNRDLAACKRFYAKGGYVRSPSNNLDRLEQELGYVGQYYADGGKVEWKAKLDAMIRKASKPDDTIINQNLRDQNEFLSPPGPREGKSAYADGGVTLPNLPSKGVPQRGPMHYGSDEEGMAGGGEFLRWVKNLASHASPSEQSAINAVRKHGEDTGREMLVMGNRNEPNYSTAYGTKTRVDLPHFYKDWIAQGDAPLFTAHNHPTYSTVPSEGDINVWANSQRIPAISSLSSDPGRQAMWIAGTKGPHDLSVMEPIDKNKDKRFAALLGGQDVHVDRDWAAMQNVPNWRGLWDRFHDFTNNKYLFEPEDARRGAASMYEHGIMADRLSERLPLHFDPAAPIAQKGTDTIGEVWPEWLKYLKSKDAMPYAEGGKVDDLELAYNSQYFGDGGRVHHRHHKGPIEIDTETRKWLAYAGLLGGVT